MSRINTPINQVRLTNVATVRITKGGKRFEIACYRNKVVNYRQGIERDLSEVLQSERVFTNVSKGEFAKSKDLQKVFGTSNEEEVLKLILEKGDLQVSDLERTQQYESVSRDIATWISEHCVHPVTQRPYTIPQIRQAMKQAEYSIHPTRTLKKQYLDCFKRIQEKEVIDIVRAKMKLQLIYPEDAEMEVKTCFEGNGIQPTEVGGTNDSVLATLLLDPSMYRALEDLSKKVNGRLEILQQVVMREGDSNIGEEMRENQHQEQQRNDDAATDEVRKISLQLEAQLDVEDPSPMSAPAEIEKDEDDDYMTSANSRKNQKKAQKKSKKAKRREKEEAEERQARIDSEAKRREERADRKGETVDSETGAVSTPGGDAVKSCNTCGGEFAKMTDYRAHFRSDWHRYNVKLKMKGATPVSEEEFRLCDSDAFFDGM